ncbi:MAG: helix-turn-helix transcriptional regulator [Bacteroidetes bacterium]|nr:helix-turn-helix transcriptional regulator [Bacteroidota bacterium]
MYGDKIRLLRVARNISQSQMAEKLGIPQNVYSQIETEHKKTAETVLNKIAIILGVALEDILNPMPVVINLHSSFSDLEKDAMMQILKNELAIKNKRIDLLVKELAALKKTSISKN